MSYSKICEKNTKTNVSIFPENFSRKENNIFFGDNLAVMSNPDFASEYKDNISFIYIDPPYNTQNNFSYRDKRTSEEWRNFLSQRLEKARELLTERGVIFISIDDNEFPTLRNLCDSIFKKENFIGTFITLQSQRSNAKLINTVHEYVVCYAKNRKKTKPFRINRMDIPEDKKMIEKLYVDIRVEFNKNGKVSAEKLLRKEIRRICAERKINWLKNYSSISDDCKIFFAEDLSTPGTPRRIDIPEINLHLAPLKTRGWASKDKFIKLYKNKRLSFKAGRPYEIHYLEESTDNVPSILNFYSRFGTNDLKKLGIDGLFDTPKPVEMIKYFMRLTTQKNDIVLDFFAGCGTTAQAVCELNRETNKNIKYVLIQLDEEVKKNTDVYKKCLEADIDANLKDILLYRINKYLQISGGSEKSYKVHNIIYN